MRLTNCCSKSGCSMCPFRVCENPRDTYYIFSYPWNCRKKKNCPGVGVSCRDALAALLKPVNHITRTVTIKFMRLIGKSGKFLKLLSYSKLYHYRTITLRYIEK